MVTKMLHSLFCFCLRVPTNYLSLTLLHLLRYSPRLLSTRSSGYVTSSTLASLVSPHSLRS